MNEVSSRSHAIFTIHITVTLTTKLSRGGAGGGGGEEGERGSAVDGEADDGVRYGGFSRAGGTDSDMIRSLGPAWFVLCSRGERGGTNVVRCTIACGWIPLGFKVRCHLTLRTRLG